MKIYLDEEARTLKISKKPKAIARPAKLWAYACEYFSHVDENPAYRLEPVKSGDAVGTTIKVPQQRPYTWEGFEAFLFQKGVVSSLAAYRTNREGRYAEYKETVAAINNIMYAQKFEGAALGHFKENLIAVAIGLKGREEKEEVATGGNIAAPTINVYNVGPALARSEKEVDAKKPDPGFTEDK